MLTKEEHIQYWIDTSDKDWEVVTTLFNAGKNVHALFFAHLVLEKLLKARWVKDNDSNTPPKTHNLVRIVAQTNIEFDENILTFLEEFNDFQLEGRYPDYMFDIYKRCNTVITNELIEKVKNIRICIQENWL